MNSVENSSEISSAPAPARQDGPRSEACGHVEIDQRWALTHATWHPGSLLGIGSNETGVRDLADVDSSTGRARFELIQHGWRDFRAAEDLIIAALRKGWNVERISRFAVCGHWRLLPANGHFRLGTR